MSVPKRLYLLTCFRNKQSKNDAERYAVPHLSGHEGIVVVAIGV